MASFCVPIMLAVITQTPALDTLNGAVHDAAGQPIAGASVFISTAAPRKGIGVLCPSCYPDCRKSAVSDGEGKFVLRDLDPELKFRLLVVARGFAPAHTHQHIMPATGAAVITLKPRDLQHRKPERVVRGKVVDANGDPIARASVSPDGVRRGNGGQFGALAKLGIDELAVTDDEGEFQLGVGEDGDALYLLIKAPMLAPVRTEPLAAGPSVHTITVGPGVTVSGRVVKDGRPLANVAMGMVQTNRNVEGYLGHFEFATDRNGAFGFVNIPPDQQWYLYGLMDSLKDFGSIPIRTVKTAGHGSTVALGDIEVQRGYRVSGRVVLSDGKPVPRDTRVLASRRAAWDSQTAIADEDGRFSFTGLPPESLSLSTKVRGYRASTQNASFDLLNRLGLMGTVKGDIDDLRFLLDLGSRPYQQPRREDYEESKRRIDAPIRGASANE
jgi:hypothetical protein